VKIPDVIEKRNLLAEKNAPAARIMELANMYFTQGALDDAFNYFEKAGDCGGLEKVKREAIKAGNSAILYNFLRSKSIGVTESDWLEAAENAMKLGKYSYAAQAFRKGGNEQRLQEALQYLPKANPLPEPPAEKLGG
jgi:hypothetical protein